MICFRLVVALAALALPVPALAASVVIWPIDPRIEAGERATALWLENSGTDPITLQVRSFLWSQDGGEDRLTDQDEIVASPPMVEIAPGARQLVRVIRRTVHSSARERSFRLFVDEVPTASPDLAAGATGARLTVQMRYSIPLFTYAPASPVATPADPLVTRVRSVNGVRTIEITNMGATHVRLTDLRAGGSADGAMLRQGLMGYVLAGATMRWPLPADVTAPVFTVSVDGVSRLLTPSA